MTTDITMSEYLHLAHIAASDLEKQARDLTEAYRGRLMTESDVSGLTTRILAARDLALRVAEHLDHAIPKPPAEDSDRPHDAPSAPYRSRVGETVDALPADLAPGSEVSTPGGNYLRFDSACTSSWQLARLDGTASPATYLHPGNTFYGPYTITKDTGAEQ